MYEKLTLIASFSYFYMIYINNVLLKYILKPATTCLIIGVSVESDKKNTFKQIGLFFSLLGDICLMFEGEDMFLLGLASFLCAHLSYIYFFYHTRRTQSHYGLKIALLFIGSLYYSALYTRIFEQGGYPMLFAVFIYIITIVFMVYFAFLSNDAQLTLGATLFFISDATLGYDKFIEKSTRNIFEYIVMITYYSAQFLIAKS
ncbi:YhhN-like protein [Gilbertella persicaria]|uniref:YhhN-like protein n=1 Tax=Gilbertella persicaria TaxID=101096 RepID=UPI0022205DD9|nr:YhhN-like protein [Gilbertella persicaria]KAI8091061.1 YhhN-like protein [Gilbertella persicaria]